MVYSSIMFTHYLQLLKKVDATVAELEKRHNDHLRCSTGCDDCCQQELNVCPVELAFIARTIEGMTKELQAQIERRLGSYDEADGDCPLLLQGRCLVYEARPLICRTHGLVLDLAEQDEKSQIELTCAFNYTGLALSDLPPGEAIKQVVLSTILYHVNLPFAESFGLDPSDRLPLSQVMDLL